MNPSEDSVNEVRLENGYVREMPNESSVASLKRPSWDESTRWFIASGICALIPLLALLSIPLITIQSDGGFSPLPGLVFLLVLFISSTFGMATALFGLRMRSKRPDRWIGIPLLTLHLFLFVSPILLMWRPWSGM